MANEKRLIDANELVYALYRSDAELHSSQWETSEIVDEITRAPTADAVEVVHGRWVMDEYKHQYCCSVCGTVQPYDSVEDYIDPEIVYYDYWDCNYCPNCGANMDGDGNG